MGLFRNASTLLASSVLRIPIGMLTGAILARYLSIEDRGVYAVAASISAAVALASQLGWPVATVYRIRRKLVDPALASGTTLLASLALPGLVVVLAVCFRDPIRVAFLEGTPNTVLYLALAVGFFTQVSAFFSGLCRGIDRFELQFSAQLLRRLGLLAGIFVVLVLYDADLLAVLWIALGVGAIGAVGLAVVVIRAAGLRLRSAGTEIRAALHFGSKSWVQGLAGGVHERVDIFMLAYLLDDTGAVAIYAVAAGAASYLKLMPEAIAGAVFPQLAAAEDEQVTQLAAFAVRHALFWLVLTGIAAVLSGWLIIPFVYGQPYAASVAPFLVLVVAIPFHAFYRLIARYFIAIDRQAINVGVQVPALLLNVALNLWLIPGFGIMGAAAASLVSYVFEGTVMVGSLVLSTRLSLREMLFLDRSDLEIYWSRLAELRRRFQSPA